MNVENWETDHLQHDLDISYNFTLALVFVSRACTKVNMNTFITDFVLFFYRDSVLMKACIFNNHKL